MRAHIAFPMGNVSTKGGWTCTRGWLQQPARACYASDAPFSSSCSQRMKSCSVKSIDQILDRQSGCAFAAVWVSIELCFDRDLGCEATPAPIKRRGPKPFSITLLPYCDPPKTLQDALPIPGQEEEAMRTQPPRRKRN